MEKHQHNHTMEEHQYNHAMGKAQICSKGIWDCSVAISALRASKKSTQAEVVLLYTCHVHDIMRLQSAFCILHYQL